jgi:orotidine-5'-phosphate decarboxylase
MHLVKPHLWQQPPTDGTPWVCDYRSYDIDNTIAGAIRTASNRIGCVAVTFSMLGGRTMIFAAEAAASECGIRVLWWFGPSVNDISAEGRAYLRRCVAEARTAATAESKASGQ